MNATAFAHTSPFSNRRHEHLFVSPIDIQTSVDGHMGSKTNEQPSLVRLISICEAMELVCVELLDMEELYSLDDDFAGKQTEVETLLSEMAVAAETADEALLDVFRYTPANEIEAFAKTRWLLDFKKLNKEEWRDCEVEALICSTTGGWTER